ncbi:MAG: class I SAM-dependent methyltransferase [Thermoplasmata archaeon]
MRLFKCLRVFLSGFYTGLKFFSGKDPPFYEIVESYEEYHSSPHISENSLMRLKLIERWIEPYSSVLEVGCGEGFNLAWLRDVKKINGVGIDISVKAIEKVRSLGFEGYVKDVDVEGIGFGPREFTFWNI